MSKDKEFDTADFQEEDEFVTEEEIDAARQEEERKLAEENITIPHEVKLKFPVQWGKNEPPRDMIVVKRRLKTKDLMNFPADKQKFGHMVSLISKVTGEPLAFIKEIDSHDMVRLTKIIQHFL